MSPAGSRILIVEDERILAADLGDQLASQGYKVCGRVGTGDEALEAVESQSPDLVLMDIQIEGPMDGIEVASRIKQGFNTPVIYLTAFSSPEILERAKITEPFGYLVKPVNQRELVASIEMALFKAAMEAELRAANQALQKALSEVKQLSGLLPICASCKKIRDDQGYWQQIESYIQDHSHAQFSHGICPECKKKLYPEIYGDKDTN